MPNVAFIIPELKNLLSQYNLISDCISGEEAVKSADEKYLPKPNKEDVSPENRNRYLAYKKRAVFYNVTRRTLNGLIGQVFMRDPVIELPNSLKVLEDDISGGNVSLVQQVKKTLGYAIAFSRAGLFVDYPFAEEGKSPTIKDVETGLVRPTVWAYGPKEIINWRTKEIGAKTVLSLVVINEAYTSFDDGFEVRQSNQIRVLQLDKSNVYQMSIYTEESPSDYSSEPSELLRKNFNQVVTVTPKDHKGKPFTEIPFTFIGSENNDSYPDNPNFYDLASLNIAHYRNSADYEEACYILGQPTPVATGLTKEWVTEVLGGKLKMGSVGGIALPVGATFAVVQAKENTMIKEAMEIKERQMVALGAKLVEQKAVQRTAYETKQSATSESSVLATVTKNVESAYKFALEFASKYVGDTGEIKFELNVDFDISSATPEERSAVVKEWQSEAITFTEMRNMLRRAGVATVDDEIAKTEIANDSDAKMQKQIALAQATKPVPTKPEGK